MVHARTPIAKPDNAGAGATDYMHLFGLVAMGYMWARMAKAAHANKALGDGSAATMEAKLADRPLLHGADAARDRQRSCAHRRRLGYGDGAAGGDVLTPFAARLCYSFRNGALGDFEKLRETPMADAFIYDAVRTPRGRGKPDGSLHEVAAVDLAVTTLDAIRERNDLDPRTRRGRRARLRRSGRRSGRRHRPRRGR